MSDYITGGSLLKLTDVSLSFSDKVKGDKLILRDINLDVKDIIRTGFTTGQVISLLGCSGIGKTQLLKMIAGLQESTTGTILVGSNLRPVKAGTVGMVLQSYPLFKHRTVLSNLRLVEKDISKIEYYLQEFNLIEHKNKYPGQLSGGQRQRTAIIQQLLCSDHFILFDEIFSGLDPVAIEKLCRMIMKIASLHEDNTIIISSHILEPALAISDRVLMLGNELDAEQKKIPGAVIRFDQDLAAMGLSWREDIRRDPKFVELLEDIRQAFYKV